MPTDSHNPNSFQIVRRVFDAIKNLIKVSIELDVYSDKFFELTEPTATTEVITWYLDSTKATVFSIITITYTTSSKRTIFSFEEVIQ